MESLNDHGHAADLIANMGETLFPRAAARGCAPRLGEFSTCYTDELGNDWDVTYDLEGERHQATDTSPAEFPVAIVRSVELGGLSIPLDKFGAAFADVVQEHCAMHASRAGL